jgi:hypothetical protein
MSASRHGQPELIPWPFLSLSARCRRDPDQTPAFIGIIPSLEGARSLNSIHHLVQPIRGLVLACCLFLADVSLVFASIKSFALVTAREASYLWVKLDITPHFFSSALVIQWSLRLLGSRTGDLRLLPPVLFLPRTRLLALILRRAVVRLDKFWGALWFSRKLAKRRLLGIT